MHYADSPFLSMSACYVLMSALMHVRFLTGLHLCLRHVPTDASVYTYFHAHIYTCAGAHVGVCASLYAGLCTFLCAGSVTKCVRTSACMPARMYARNFVHACRQPSVCRYGGVPGLHRRQLCEPARVSDELLMARPPDVNRGGMGWHLDWRPDL